MYPEGAARAMMPTMNFRVHVAPAAEFPLIEIAALLREALVELHHEAALSFEAPAAVTDGAIAIVVGPHRMWPAVAADRGPRAALRAARSCVHLVTAPLGDEAFEQGAPYACSGRLALAIDPLAAAELSRRGARAAHLPLGYHASHDRWDGAKGERPIDVAFLGTLTPRRERLLAQLADKLPGRRFEILARDPHEPLVADQPGHPAGDAKYGYLARCKAVVDLRATEAPRVAWPRLMDAVHNGAVVVAEPAGSANPFVAGQHYMEAEASALADVLTALLDDPLRRDRMAYEAYHLLREQHLFTSHVSRVMPLLTSSGAPSPARTLARGRARAKAWAAQAKRAFVDRARRVDRSAVAASKAQLDAATYEARIEWRTLYQRQLLIERNFARRLDALAIQLATGKRDAVNVRETSGWSRPGFIPGVSVVVTAYNYATYLAEALDSAFASVDVQVEIVVVDDASTDATPMVLGRLVESHDQRAMKVVTHQSNRGLSAARNTGFAHCRAEYVFVLDADNAIGPTCIAQCAAAMRKQPEAAFAYPIIAKFGADQGLLSAFPWRQSQLMRRNTIDAMALVRRSAWASVGGYRTDVDAEFGGLEDWALWLAFAERGWPGVLVPRVLARYRVHAGSMINATVLNPRLTARIVAKFPGLSASPK